MAEGSTKTAFISVWHIIGMESFVFGIAFIIMAFQQNMAKTKYMVLAITVILVLRGIIILYYLM
jgi:lipid-A-disaccharide synthase-like uncharacterized protein